MHCFIRSTAWICMWGRDQIRCLTGEAKEEIKYSKVFIRISYPQQQSNHQQTESP